MFGLFKKKQVDQKKVEAFCDWFISMNEEIIRSVENSNNDHARMMHLLDEVENQLAVVYRDGYKGDIQFEYGFASAIDKWELNLFHLNNKFLIEATNAIATILNAKLSDTWLVNTDK